MDPPGQSARWVFRFARWATMLSDRIAASIVVVIDAPSMPKGRDANVPLFPTPRFVAGFLACA